MIIFCILTLGHFSICVDLYCIVFGVCLYWGILSPSLRCGIGFSGFFRHFFFVIIIIIFIFRFGLGIFFCFALFAVFRSGCLLGFHLISRICHLVLVGSAGSWVLFQQRLLVPILFGVFSRSDIVDPKYKVSVYYFAVSVFTVFSVPLIAVCIFR